MNARESTGLVLLLAALAWAFFETRDEVGAELGVMPSVGDTPAPRPVRESRSQRAPVGAASPADPVRQASERLDIRKKDWIEGRVIDVAGAPVAGAQVDFPLTGWEGTGEGGGDVTGTTGTFSLRAPDRFTGRSIRVQAPGFVTRLAAPGGGEFLSIELSRGTKVSGRLLVGDEGGGASPRGSHAVHYHIAEKVRATTQTLADGRFELFAPPNSKLRLVVPFEGEAPWEESVPVGVREVVHDIEIPNPNGAIEVQVRDHETQSPIGGAQITTLGFLVGETSPDGLLHVPFRQARTHRLYASASHYATRFGSLVHLAADAHERLQIDLRLGGQLFGRIVDNANRPIAGAAVTLVRTDGWRRRREPEGADLGEASPLLSGATGGFEFTGLESSTGSVRGYLSVDHPRYAPNRSARFAVVFDERKGPLDVILEEAGTVTGILTSNGDPAHARISVEGYIDIRGQTDDSGAFRLDQVPKGSQRLVAYLESDPHITQAFPVEVRAGETRAVELALDFNYVPLTGVVANTRGTRIPNVPLGCHAPPDGRRSQQLHASRTRTDGTFSFEVPQVLGTPSIEYRIQLHRWYEDDFALSTPPVDGMLITAEASREISLRPTNAMTGEAIDETDVVWLSGVFEGSAERVLGCSEAQVNAGQVTVHIPVTRGWLVLEAEGFESRNLRIPVGTNALGKVELQPAE